MERHGIPLHRWSPSNLKKIEEVWGKVVQLDYPIKPGEDFEATKILIDITYFPFINDWIRFSLNGLIYDEFFVTRVNYENKI